MAEIRAPQSVRFEGFELDLRSGELRRDGGNAIRLTEQPFRILVLLLEHPQEVVTREELRKKLWPNDTIVEFEHSISAAINRLRQALGDSAQDPRYIETLARRGYRWMVPLKSGSLVSTSSTSPGTTSISENLIGKRMSHYRVLELIGGGGMGVVYKAEDLKLGRQVALKFLPEELTKDPVALGRFEQEARSASALDHPNICAIYEFDEYEGRPFIVMQLLEGQTLRERIAAGTGQGTAISLSELIEVAIQISEGLEAAHRKGIIHRDIKPANIFITSRGEAKILDFGLAKLRGTTQDVRTATLTREVKDAASGTELRVPTSSAAALALTKTSQTMGTASYMSPEQVRCEELDARTDLFSLGLVLYEMASTRQAFAENTAALVHDAILHDTPISARALNHNLPRRFDEIITKCIQKDRKLRYQHAVDISTDLRRLKRDIESHKSTAVLEAAPVARRKQILWIVGAVIVIVAVVLVGYLFDIPWWNLRSPLPAVIESVQTTNDRLPKDVKKLVSDGTRLYFQETLPEGVTLMQVSTQGGDTARIPVALKEPTVYDISPSRSELLAGGGELKGLNAERPLWVVPLPAGPPHRVGDILANDACWAPDGRHLVFVNDRNLFVAKPDGNEVRKLATADGFVTLIRFSPDGTRLRFTVRTHPGRWDIMEIGADGSGLHRLPIQGCCGTWSADGKYYFYQTESAAPRSRYFARHYRNIWVLPERQSIIGGVELGTPVQLTAGPLSFDALAPSADGRQLFVVGHQERVELVRYENKAKQLVPFLGGISAGELDVSPDGRWVVYTTYPESTLWRSKLDGSERLQLTFAPMNAHEPRWSPDGKQILFSDVPSKIFIVPAEGGTPQQLMPADNPTVIGSAAWLPDGNSIVFGRVMGCSIIDYYCFQKIAIYLLDLKTQQISKVLGSDRMYAARISRNGRYITAFSVNQNKVMLYDFQTKRWTELAQGIGAIAWSHDSKFVYLELTQGAPPELVRISVPGGKIERLLDLRDITLGGYWPEWISLLPDDSPLLMLERSTQEIYRLDLQYR